MKKCAFVIPYYIEAGYPERMQFFKDTINSVINQTCSDWLMILVDDNSCNEELDAYIKRVMLQHGRQMAIHKNTENLGAGQSRNIGIDMAADMGADVVMFLDSDDIAHPRRVERTRELFERDDVDVLYSTFVPIDEYGHEIPEDKLPHNIRFILENNRNPSVGAEVWKQLFKRDIYINLTSSTSVRTSLAKAVPFPPMRSSEDLYVWMMYSAAGGCYQYCSEIPGRYRMPQENPGKSLSTCFGPENAYRDFADAYLAAFGDCVRAALERGAITEPEVPGLSAEACDVLINELNIVGMKGLADEYSERLRK